MGKKTSLAKGGAVAVAESDGSRRLIRSSLFAQARLIFFLLPAAFMTPWTLFERKLLSPELARPIGRLYFWPTFSLTLFRSWWGGLGFWCELDDTALLGVAPVGLMGFPRQLHQLGVRGVVNMQDEYGGPEQEYERLGIEQLWLPTIDHAEPSLADLKAACLFVDKFRNRGERVYIHCKAGHGRGAAAAFAWLAYSREVSSDEDLRLLNEELLSKRRVRRSLHEQPNIRGVAEWIRAGYPKPLPWEQPLHQTDEQSPALDQLQEKKQKEPLERGPSEQEL